MNKRGLLTGKPPLGPKKLKVEDNEDNK